MNRNPICRLVFSEKIGDSIKYFLMGGLVEILGGENFYDIKERFVIYQNRAE